MKISWVNPGFCIPPHAVTHPEKMYELANMFVEYGWGIGYDALVGYPWEGEIQLVTGTHRHAAAVEAKIDIPVVIKPAEEFREASGDLDKWKVAMETLVV